MSLMVYTCMSRRAYVFACTVPGQVYWPPGSDGHSRRDMLALKHLVLHTECFGELLSLLRHISMMMSLSQLYSCMKMPDRMP